MTTPARLTVDTERPTAAATRLADLARTFQDANVNARDLHGALGHRDPSAAIGEHAIGWDEIRVGMVKDIGFLGEACGRIGERFAELDEVFSRELHGLV